MNQEIIQLLTAIVNTPGIDLDGLQKRLGGNSKSIEYLLKKTNDLLESHGYQVIERRKRKVWIGLDIVDLNHLIQELQKEKVKVLDRSTRVILLILLLFCTKKTSLSFFAEKLNVSKNTIVSDLATVKRLVDSEKLELKYTRKDGYFLFGEEIKIRIMVIRQLHQLLEQNWQGKMVSYFIPIEEKEIYSYKERLVVMEKVLHTQLSTRQTKLMSVLLPLIKLRIINYCSLSLAEGRSLTKIITKEDYYRMEKALIRSGLSKEFDKEEQSFLIIQLLSANVVKSNMEDNSELGRTIDEMIAKFEMNAVLFFEEKKKLKQMLFQHLGPAIYRLKYGIPYEDHSIEVVVKKYGAIFPIVKQALSPIERNYQIQFTEIETVYVGLIFQSFLTKTYLLKQKAKIRAIVVCENGISVSNLLFETLAQVFPMIDFIANVSARQFYGNPLIYSDITVVFSTIYLKTSKKLFLVPPILSSEEKQRLIKTVNQELYGREHGVELDELMKLIQKKANILDESGLRKELKEYLDFSHKKEDYVTESKFNRFLPANRIRFSKRKFTFDEAIKAVAEPLLKEKIIEERFVETIIRKYDEQFPYFVIAPEIAIPHAGYKDGVNNIGFSLLKLEHPVRFSDVLLVRVLLMIAPVDNVLHQKAVQAFYNCMTNERDRNQLLSLKDPIDIRNFFLQKIR